MRESGIGLMCDDAGGARGTVSGAQGVGGAWSSGMGEAVQVYAWGRGEDGQLGLGDGSHQLRPRLIESLSDKEVTQVVCGSGHTVVLTRDGKVYTWGRGDDGRLGHKDHGWKHEPVLVSSISSKTIVQVTCGSYHTAAVSIDGELYTWGGGMYGKLGHGSEDGSSEPKRVETLKEKTVLQVACGGRHTVVLVRGRSVKGHTARLAGKSSAEVYSWGDRDNGVSGHGEMEGRQYYPRLLSALADKNVCQIAACGFHTAAVTEFGEVYTWGEGKFGRLGHDCEGNEAEPRKVQNKQLAACRVVEIACGGFHTAAVTDKGEIFTWGGGEHGQLGQGNKENYTAPTLVSALADVHLRQVACGWSHTVVLSDDGEVWSFGNGDYGKLGHGDTEKKPWPTKIEGMTHKNIVRVASYNEHTAALALTEVHTAPNSSLIADYTRMLESGEFADVEFLVDDVRIPAHRAVLAARSEHFCAMFQSGMKESCEGVIQINEVCPVVFRALLSFLYTGTIDIGPESAFELLALADLYRLDRLKAQCESIVLRKLCHQNAPVLLNKADMSGAEDLKVMCMRFIVRHFEVISKLPEFALLDRGLIIEILQLR